MDKKKKIFIIISVVFFVIVLIIVYDMSRRTTFPGSKSHMKESIAPSQSRLFSLVKNIV